MKKILTIIGFIWLFPMTLLVWLFYILPLMRKDLEFKGWQSFLIAKFRVKSEKSWYAKLWRDWAGWSGPCAILYNESGIAEDQLKRTFKHEERHCKQQFVFGVFFYPVYILTSVFIWLFMKNKHSYLDNPFERDARKAAGQHVDIPKSYWEAWYGKNDRWPWW